MPDNAEISNLNREEAKSDPEKQFASPKEVLDHVGLTRAEKITALREWANLVDRRLLAGDEGMPTRGTDTRDAELLREIETALERLQPGDNN